MFSGDAEDRLIYIAINAGNLRDYAEDYAGGLIAAIGADVSMNYGNK